VCIYIYIYICVCVCVCVCLITFYVAVAEFPAVNPLYVGKKYRFWYGVSGESNPTRVSRYINRLGAELCVGGPPWVQGLLYDG